MYKFKHFIQQDKINWGVLSRNENAIHILEQNPDKIIWGSLSFNPNAIHLLERYRSNIDWSTLSENPNALHLLTKYQYKIDWECIFYNVSIFELDYKLLFERCDVYKSELLKKTLHPSRVKRYLDMGIDYDDLENYL